MSPKVPTAVQLARLRAAFTAKRPSTLADFATAAASAQVTIGAARRAWRNGWPAAHVEPLERELAAAPTERQAAAAVVTAEVVAAACLWRANALGRCATALINVASNLTVKLCQEDVNEMPPAFALASLSRVVSVIERCGRAASEAVELKRLVDGQAQRIVSVQHEPAAPVDLDAARVELAAAQRALDRMSRRVAPASAERDATTVEPSTDRGGRGLN